MKRYLAAAIAVCCSVGLLGNANARDRDWGDRGPRHERSWRDNDRHHSHHRHERRDRGWRGGPPPSWHRGPPPRVIVVPAPRGPRWSRGDRLPHRYLGPRHVVRDWRSHNFRPPPRGHQWVHVNGEYLLVGIATGLILQAIVGR